MRIFKVPFDIKREEKIFGGYLSLRQVIYLMLSASNLAIFAFHIPLAIKIVFITLICSFFLLCAFLRIGEQNFDKVCYFAIKYLLRKKKFMYVRCEKW